MPRVRRAALLFASALVVPVAACSSILGIQDRSLDTQVADAATSDVTVDGMPHVDGGSDSPATDGPGTDSGTMDAPSCESPCALATGLNETEAITSDSTNVYWTEFGDMAGTNNGSVKGCPLAGCGTAPTVYASGQGNPVGIVSDGQTIYWGNYGSGGIFSCPTSGCANSPTLVANAGSPWGIAIDASYVYWIDSSDNSLHRALRAVAADAGASSDNMLWDAASGLSYSSDYVAVDDASAYLIDDNSDIFKIPLTGGTSLTLFASGGSGGNLFNLVIDPGGLVFGTAAGQILRASKTTPDAASPLISMLADPSAVTVDPATGDIYWADWGTGTGLDGIIGRAHSDGSAKTSLATSLATPDGITVQGGKVYWSSRGTIDMTTMMTSTNTGAIYSAPK